MSTAIAALSAEELTPTELFRTLADSTRLRATVLMHAEGELCVCELTEALEVSQPKMSRHLAVLRDAGLVRSRREGIWIYYHLDPELAPWARSILDNLRLCNTQNTLYADDSRKLAAMTDRPLPRCSDN